MVSAKTSACCSCGRALPDPEPVILFGRKFVVRPTVCAACSIKTEAQPKKQNAWERLCPDLYQRTDIVRLRTSCGSGAMTRDGRKTLLAWQYGSQGLVLSGPTGIGKSRLMWTLLRRLLDQEVS
jgi:hypothetical protein